MIIIIIIINIIIIFVSWCLPYERSFISGIIFVNISHVILLVTHGIGPFSSERGGMLNLTDLDIVSYNCINSRPIIFIE